MNSFLDYCGRLLRKQGPDHSMFIAKKYINSLTEAGSKRTFNYDDLKDHNRLLNFWKRVYFELKKRTELK